MGSFELSSRVYPSFAVVALAGELDAAGPTPMKPMRGTTPP